MFSIVGTAYRMMIYQNPGDDITYTGMPIYAMKSVPSLPFPSPSLVVPS